MLKKNVEVFIGCESEYKKADTVIFGAPFDCTSSYRPGSRFAPAAIRGESYGIETYSPYQDSNLSDFNIFDGGDLDLPIGSTEASLKQIEKFTKKLLDDNKKFVMLGGEHLVTLGAVKAVLEKYPELYIVHFDAHADLRDDYLGVKLSHATVMRRCFELCGKGSLYQFGIRSGDRAEFEFAAANTYMNKFNFNTLDEIIDALKGKNVYFTLDLDVLDSSQFPGTGTPEAGGVSFNELLDAVIKVCGKLNIVGCDMNELSPKYDESGASTALARKMLRELLLALHS